MKKIALLGSTGSIGRQVVNCALRYPDRYKIVSLAAGSNAALLGEQINLLKPRVATLSDSSKVGEIKSLPSETTLYAGENSTLHAIVEEADLVFVAIMGFAGLESVLDAIRQKKTIALANKETLVAGGEIVMAAAKTAGVDILPVDSEHSAIWQSLYLKKDTPFEKLIITASGGAFRDVPIEKMASLKAQDALKHPNWTMGKKITIDCATMVNKGLEVIEAKWLFNCPLDKIEVLYHPESIVHSMVEYADGAIIAQMGYPSMELPISLAMSYPERLKGAPTLSLAGKTLHFFEVDNNRYPCFPLVLKSAQMGHNYPCALSAANEEAVKLYLEDKIAFTEIYDYLSAALDATISSEVTLDSLRQTDAAARRSVYQRYNSRR